MASLEQVFAFVHDFLDANSFDSSAQQPVDLAVEEIFTNMVRHNKGAGHDIMISLESKNGKLIICVTDRDVDQFKPNIPTRADIDKPISQRRSGGMGLYLVNELMDSVSWEYIDGDSKVTMTKQLENK